MSDLIDRVRRRVAAADDGLPRVLDEAVRAEVGGVADDAVYAAVRRDVTAELVGAGPLEPLLALPGVTDVLVNAPDSVWIDCGRGLELTSVRFADDGAVRRLAQRLAAGAGRRLDDATPFVDAALADGTRLHAVLPPLATHALVSLRVLARRRWTLADLEAAGAVPAEVGPTLRGLVAARLAFVVTGGTGTGKTTLLGALLSQVAPGERILLVEDAAELVVDHPHVVGLVTRGANVEGAGAVGLRELVRNALRMRPDRVVVGEFRGAEMADLLVALNTGHEGGAATMHANSAADVPARFAALGMLAGLSVQAVTGLVASALDAVVHLRRDREGARRISGIAVLQRCGDAVAAVPVWSVESGVGPGGALLAERFQQRGAAVPDELR